MCNIISGILFIAAINCINVGIEWFAVLLIASGIFAIAGALGGIGYRLDNLMNIRFKKKDLINGETEFTIIRKTENNQK